ncbi:MAG TPA: Maf family protein [Methylocystis sp.]|nr:Maf family protein [Methylocystis sp.]
MKEKVETESPRGFWRAREPLILASKSLGRRLVLQQTGIPFIARPADIDERNLEAEILASGGGPDGVVLALASAKALAVSRENAGAYVLGADQAASCEGQIFGKPEDLAAAERQLRFLSGRRHRLHSGLALAQDGKVVFEAVSWADLTMRPLGEEFIAAYLATVGEATLGCAGAYQIEGLGAHLFSAVEGDHWTILGLPLLQALEALRCEGALIG